VPQFVGSGFLGSDGDLALHLAEQRVGCIASALVLLRRHARHVAAPGLRLPCGDDRRLAIIVGWDVSAGRCSLCQTGIARLFEDGRVIPTSAAASSPAPNRRRLFFAVTTAGPVILASFRPFRFGGGL